MGGTTPGLEIEVFDDLGGLAARARELLSGCTLVALSRPTPQAVFSALDETAPARGLHLFQVDERAAPRPSEDRNLTLIELTMPRWTSHARVHAMPVEDGDLAAAAEHYAVELEDLAGSPPVLDVVHLGLGSDGHTASLLPGNDVLEVDGSSVAATRKQGEYARMTLTYPALDAARLVVFVVTGSAKAPALARVVAGDRALPASRVAADRQIVLADTQAAALVGS